MESDVLYCFIDTNTLLHYHLFTDIKWCDEFKSKEITIVLCYSVIKELDKHKFRLQDINIKNRVKKVIAKISELVKDGNNVKINDKTKLLLLLEGGSIDWIEHNLDKEDPDDQILASIINFKENNKIFITSDLGLKLKAISKGINCYSLPDRYLISEKSSKSEKEIKRLQDRINYLENRIPDLKISLLSDSEDNAFSKFSLTKIQGITEEEIKNKIDDLRNSLQYTPHKAKTPMEFAIAMYQINIPSESEIERYNKDLEQYLKEMSSYLEKEWKYRDIMSRVIELKFVLENNGNCPADDISIFFHFPDGFILFEDIGVIKKPEMPDKPTPPRTTMEILSSISKYSIPNFDFHKSFVPSKIDPKPFTGPFIRKTDSYEVTFHVQRLKHGLIYELDHFYLLIKSFEVVKSFKVEYSIVAGNSPDPFNGKIPIVFEVI